MIQENKDKVLKEIGSRIRTIRKSKELSLEALAAATGLEKANISKLENGKVNPSVWTIRRICDGLNIDCVVLFS